MPAHPDVLVGTETFDDAGVFKLTDQLAIVQTLDFFTPVVDDPYTFGQAAAANALSDVYAMGARPITALNLVAFPSDTLDIEILAEILRGGQSKIEEAQAALIGGHTVDDPVPKYGLAVNGVVHPDRVLRNSGARPGDRLILTKPLGVGVITTAMKHVELSDDVVEATITAMTTLNKGAADVMASFDVHACTDVTGFGLLGHLHEMASGSGLSALIWADHVPLLPGARALAEEDYVCGGSLANLRHLKPHITWESHVDEITRILLCDAITSGGLLIAVAPEQAGDLIDALASGLTS